MLNPPPLDGGAVIHAPATIKSLNTPHRHRLPLVLLCPLRVHGLGGPWLDGAIHLLLLGFLAAWLLGTMAAKGIYISFLFSITDIPRSSPFQASSWPARFLERRYVFSGKTAS